MKKELLSLGLLLGSFGFAKAEGLVSEHPSVSSIFASNNEITVDIQDSGLVQFACTGKGATGHSKTYSKSNNENKPRWYRC